MAVVANLQYRAMMLDVSSNAEKLKEQVITNYQAAMKALWMQQNQ